MFYRSVIVITKQKFTKEKRREAKHTIAKKYPFTKAGIKWERK